MLSGDEGDCNWLLPDVLVNVSRGGDDDANGVVKEVLPVRIDTCNKWMYKLFSPCFNLFCCANVCVNLNFQDGSCRVALDSSGSGDEVIAFPNELEVVRPKKNDRLKIMNGSMRGVSGKLIGVDGSDGIVRVDGTVDVKIVDMVILGKLAT